MRLTIIPSDKAIGIDGEFFSKIGEDLSWIPSNIHAIQWYDTWGEVEYNDGSPNEKIEELGIFEQAIQTVEDEKVRLENERLDEEAAREAARDYWSELRSIRDSILSKCDWTQSSDSPLTEEKKEEWRLYRQALRNLPEIITDPKPLVLDKNHPAWPLIP
jgi:hypothetical protein